MDNVSAKIGKDIIESLTLGMYEDPRFIYREYIQNSADQIDSSVKLGLFSNIGEGQIHIEINKSERKIQISDNGTGIKTNEFESILKNIALSTKDRSKHKGFRGIGRLGGIGYCDQLIFECSFQGEEIKSQMIWDGKKLKEIINDRSTKEEANEVIDSITAVNYLEEKKELHYFNVILVSVSNDKLLEADSIYEYLSLVSPVPYSKGFIFKSKIRDKCEELNISIDEYKIFIKGQGQIYKAYTSKIYEGSKNNKKSIDEISNIEFVEFRDNQNSLIAIGWYSLSNFNKVMPSVNIAKGIRLRKGNIQIGNYSTLVKFHREERGNGYFFGEIHAVSSNLIPNARRDYFLENDELLQLESQMISTFKILRELYYLSSTLRSNQKKIEDFNDLKDEYVRKSETSGFTNKEERDEILLNLEIKRENAEKAKKNIEKERNKVEGDRTKLKLVKNIIDDELEIKEFSESTNKPKFVTDGMSTLTKNERKLVSKIFSIISNILPKDISSVVQEKIKEELK